MTKEHKVFISFHHDENNEQGKGDMYRTAFESLFGNKTRIVETKAIHDGDIDPDLPEEKIKEIICKDYIQDTEVTIVLLGPHTWTRKYVDWEISASLRTKHDGKPSGLLGLLLPEHPCYLKDQVIPHSIPARLTDNLNTGFALIANWTFNVENLKKLIHGAAQRRKTFQHDDTRSLLTKDIDPNSKVEYFSKRYILPSA